MTREILIVAAALVLALGITPVARRMAHQFGVLDQPNARKVHVKPTPLLGGVAIYIAFVLALLFLGDLFYVNQVIGIFIGASFVSFLGLVDDSRGLRPLIKLGGQVVAALILVLSGVTADVFPGDGLDIALTVVWVVGITNAMNLLDNMDGLSGGLAAIAAAFFMVLASLSRQYLVGALAAALLGACIGFLRYNFNPASIFMGDSGSLFLGFVLAATAIKLRFPSNVVFVTWMVPVLVLGLPIFDTTLVFVSRLRRGLNPLTTPGKDHISHRLVRLMHGSRREAVLTCYLLAGAFGLIAIFLTQAAVAEAYAVALAVLGICLWALWRLEQVPVSDPPAP
ncbi:MraY family glycosyltransferase [Candidatus Amarolinea dominans]|uniref:MraY family glycosyltransferase n=1 Tax=Candidatus Amarolinea dominans TaxID=3140696 RepID=UPI001D8EF1C7|nr:undecaprenyl/decaprenyl-phosphate alpha-N-acetylglucosaminyl 1-phosphate transferase [Anaerolineae bacterium]MBK7203535.1 undecaprenyl/decaprenyl-phosphate alpha-N-acetylglucosaminyl 1-phosphate transferase [Anaerolineae bacterium]MBK9091962.1 undecaprenyl/decaprenyl-phosphate alpha-N-acetylglucosaminyl 1-phosphate transferase [Anaerolineae bacterium]MBK9229693.1 undecaprenyl/decaprenyl-phosphate alpha-N-acetylglucosaminyl 1-phosphate transferase [Anaerolineae bacterium]